MLLGHCIFERHDRILARPVRPELDHLLRGARAFVGFLENVFSAGFVVELARRGVESNGHLFSGLISCGGGGLTGRFAGFFGGTASLAAAACIPRVVGVTPPLYSRTWPVEEFRPPLELFANTPC